MNLDRADELIDLRSNALTWMAVHGNLCLALRHPGNTGESRSIVIGMVRTIGKALVASGIISQAELDQIEQVEHGHAPSIN